MKKKIQLILSMSAICIYLCSCGSQGHSLNSSGNDTKDIITVKDSIDISEINPELVKNNTISMDMNVYNPSIELMKNKADIIFKGILIQAEPYVSSNSRTIYSNYTYKVEEMYKGEKTDSITVNMLGGLMKVSDYMEQLKELGLVEEVKEDDGTYTFSGMEGVSPLDLNEEYIVFACYNENKENYYQMYYYYGLFQESENGEYICCMNSDEMETIKDDSVLKS